MLVSHRHRFVYTKTRKTAGTSVESYFEPYCMAPGEWSLSHERSLYETAHGIVGQRGGGNAREQRWWNHMPAATIREQLGRQRWESYFKFCVVRNPFDMVISLFYFRRQSGLLPTSELGDAEQFRAWLLSAPLTSDRPIYCLDGVPCMDYFVRYERLSEDLSAVCSRLGLPWQPERLPTFKKGLRPEAARPERLHNAATRERVQQAFAAELEQFGYCFEQTLETR